MTPLERVRASVYARRLMHLQLDEAVHLAIHAGVNRASLASALGISRASFYRQYSCWIEVLPGKIRGEGVVRVASRQLGCCCRIPRWLIFTWRSRC